MRRLRSGKSVIEGGGIARAARHLFELLRSLASPHISQGIRTQPSLASSAAPINQSQDSGKHEPPDLKPQNLALQTTLTTKHCNPLSIPHAPAAPPPSFMPSTPRLPQWLTPTPSRARWLKLLSLILAGLLALFLTILLIHRGLLPIIAWIFPSLRPQFWTGPSTAPTQRRNMYLLI